MGKLHHDHMPFFEYFFAAIDKCLEIIYGDMRKYYKRVRRNIRVMHRAYTSALRSYIRFEPRGLMREFLSARYLYALANANDIPNKRTKPKAAKNKFWTSEKKKRREILAEFRSIHGVPEYTYL
jgi:hypothetical protein